MDRMIERVAAMIQGMHGTPDQPMEYFADTAFAVLRDLREPTDAMVKAAGSKCGADAWRAMIDEVLGEHVDIGAAEPADPDAHRNVDDDPMPAAPSILP